MANPNKVSNDPPQFLSVDDIKNFRMLVGMLRQPNASVKRGRGPQKKPKKVMTSIRLDKEVYEFFKESGPGWQGEINQLLKAHTRRRKSPKRN